jgi:DNA mismatch repair protein MutS
VSGVHNVHLSATEHNDNIVFLHRIEEGAASQSYGLQVAKLAGIPQAVINEAQQQLQLLESGEHPHSITTNDQKSSSNRQATPQQNELFPAPPHPVLVALEAIDPNDLSPKQALDILFNLKKTNQ